MQKLDQFINILNEILAYAEMESTKINSGFFKYGKKQRMLESTHIITDSLSALDKTPLGSKILELQKLFNSF